MRNYLACALLFEHTSYVCTLKKNASMSVVCWREEKKEKVEEAKKKQKEVEEK